ncbi:single-stranded DNA-binding protein [Actinomyces minihominis]|uniref:single-stranded DNA-binding protein n=1 Tax=Actinomyces minihominis TaxID=2002838 RepID=UPI000C08B9C5|nr:single-stranded DNA-binding protein [Actinomyces minihominis]
MALRALTTGVIADPVLRWTPQQKAVLDLRLNATASARDKVTNQWSDLGSPLWVGATFWDEEAKHLADVLHKGDRVTVEGTLVVETFQRRDGTEGHKYVLRFPRFLGVVPARRNLAEDAGAYGGGQHPERDAYPDTGSIPIQTSRQDFASPEDAPF